MSLVPTLRRMTGVAADQYTVAGTLHWTDADLQGVLDDRVSARLIQAEIELIPTIDADGHIVFLHGRAHFPGTLDVATVDVVTFVGAAIADATVDTDGRIEFASDQVGKGPLISGLAYDLYGAAADVLTEWASAIKLGYDITVEGQTAARSQRHKQILEQAAQFRAQTLPGTTRLGRSDVRGRVRGRATRAILRSWHYLGR